MSFKKSQKLYEKGLVNLVGAVNSPVRAFTSVGGNPLFIKRGRGSQIIDVDGNKYVDLVLSYGPMILGHRHKKVQKAVHKALKNGYSFGASTENEITLAKIVCDAFPGMDKVRFVNSGTEAVLSGVRLARAYTGKDKIIKFSGCYHGHQDSLLVAAGSGLATLSIPGSKGVPKEAVKNTLIATYNDLDSVKKHFEKHSDIAGVIIEPVGGNMGVVIPQNGFLKELKDFLHTKGALLIADEVMTGFGKTGRNFASDFIDTKPDIICLSKALTAGLVPMAITSCTEKIYEAFLSNEMAKGFFHCHTYSANPIACAAANAAIALLQTDEIQDNIKYISASHKEFQKRISKHSKVKTARFQGIIFALDLDTKMSRYGSLRDKLLKFFMDRGVFFTSVRKYHLYSTTLCNIRKTIAKSI